ncbi:LysR substrate-binding domain-containing protein [Mycobacteroides abscessus]|uniref:LysR substrate-binding domain-containing protein n=1 Tax=Mycobacteroides abscessus TaxID=36809 RepID=UPI0009A72359|nr:transcriptional regulator [Mycobacteroides abscessus subsp. abscessus]
MDSSTSDVLCIGVPSGLLNGLLTHPLLSVSLRHPLLTIDIRQLEPTIQLREITGGNLDIGIVWEFPEFPLECTFNGTKLLTEKLGVLTSNEVAATAGPSGIGLGALSGIKWIGPQREESPAWYDAIITVLRRYGLDAAASSSEASKLGDDEVHEMIRAGKAFSLVPRHASRNFTPGVAWVPLQGEKLVRHTWAVWLANAGRPAIQDLIVAFGGPITVI